MAVGTGVLRGMGITLRHFLQTYITGYKEQPVLAGDVPYGGETKGLRGGMPTGTSGLITCQYPEQKLPVPERFRCLPMLLYDEDTEGPRAAFGGIRCTACGICAKVCPPQCIWIGQSKGPDGRPRLVPASYYVDASICMSCGFCAEFCPFDAIKMDHDFELSSYERRANWVMGLQELLRPLAYHAAIHPEDYARELADRRAKEEARRRRDAAAHEARSGGLRTAAEGSTGA
jgi:NADH-quinone oxidoreductase subunit I